MVSAAQAAEITAARYVGPTERYPHAVLGDAIEHDTLRVTLSDGREIRARYPDVHVFEDTAPRVIDLDGDGAPEVITVESHETRGARLAIWGLRAGELRQIAATPHIGTRFRWLAPTGIGAADLDGDGRMELAYVDRPHLAKTLRVWRFEQDKLAEVASLPGVTNHRIGERDIAGGIRDCGAAPEIIVADANWRRLMAVTLTDGALTARDIGPHQGRGSFSEAMGCK
ncbi:FG-GAP repeat domain-containing protein [Primorskyibacter sp. S187A]|uniref:FG-GAP repeat domain-containing protein n=1 Tax=Primorskyibacter sp. S187A TaxID=3415130 RepID=UPI003C7E7DDB